MKRRDLLKSFIVLTAGSVPLASSPSDSNLLSISSTNNGEPNSDLIHIDFLSDLDSLKELPHNVTIRVKHYSKNIHFDEPAFFTYDKYDNVTREDGGLCIISPIGGRFKRDFSGVIKANWFGASTNNLRVEELKHPSDLFMFNKLSSLFRTELAVGYYNNFAINAALDACSASNVLEFTQGSDYLIDGPLISKNCFSINGRGSRIIVAKSIPLGARVLTIGRQKGVQKQIKFTVTKGSDKFPISEIKFLSNLKIGDLISFKSHEIRCGQQYENIRPYFHGMRAVIKDISSNYIIIDRYFYAPFEVNEIYLHEGSSNLSINDLIIDTTSFQDARPPLTGIQITGTNISLNRLTISGSEYCGTGISIIGCNATINNTSVSGFCNIQGLPLPGRTGYGIFVDCNNTIIDNCFFKANKHHVSCASRDYVMSDLLIKNCSALTTLADRFKDVNAAFDLHANVIGNVEFNNLYINTQGPAFNIRNGDAHIYGCNIISSRYNKKTPALINVFDYKSVNNIIFQKNKLNCGNNLRLFHFGEITDIELIDVSNNIGSIGALFDHDLKNMNIQKLSITYNRVSGMRFLMNINMLDKDSSLNIGFLEFDSNSFLQSGNQKIENHNFFIKINSYSDYKQCSSLVSINEFHIVDCSFNIRANDLIFSGVDISNLNIANSKIITTNGYGRIHMPNSSINELSIDNLRTNLDIEFDVLNSHCRRVKKITIGKSNLRSIILNFNDDSIDKYNLHTYNIIGNNFFSKNSYPMVFNSKRSIIIDGVIFSSNKILSSSISEIYNNKLVLFSGTLFGNEIITATGNYH
jgi:hypothetical protein